MEAFVTGLHIILCLFLILVVLLQPGKGADFGAMMGGSTTNTGSAAQGATLIGKLTAVVATLFMVTSMTLAWFSNQGQNSVITDDALMDELQEQEGESPVVPGTDAGDEAPEGDEAPVGDEQPADAVPGAEGSDIGAPDGAAPGSDVNDGADGDPGEADGAPAEGAAPDGSGEAPAAGDEAPAGDGAGDEAPKPDAGDE